MNREAKELKAFIDRIAAEPGDLNTRRIFADWLDEHDEPELADEQRKIVAENESGVTDAKGRMMKAAADYMPYCKTPEEGYNKLLKEAQEGAVNFWGSDGPAYGLEREYPEFWDDVELLTGKGISHEHRESTSFRCYC